MEPIAGYDALETARRRTLTGDDGRSLRRAADRGTATRVQTGVYVDSALWSGLSVEQRYRLRVAAAYAGHGDPFVASHRAAGALWQVPSVAAPPAAVDVLATFAAGTRTEHGMRKHAVRDPLQHVVAVFGVPCTNLERTIIDIARTEPFGHAVVAADWALREHTDLDTLRRVLAETGDRRGRRRAEAVLAFADGASGSAGESLSRAGMHLLGFPKPELQVPFHDARGLIGLGDFFWREHRLLGEFDGLVKYRDPRMRGGRTPEQVVIDEKLREDRMRTQVSGVVRWVWADAVDLSRLGTLLRAAGLRGGR